MPQFRSPLFSLLFLIRATLAQPRLCHRLIACFGGVQAAVSEFRAGRDASRCGLGADAATALQARLQDRELLQLASTDMQWLQGPRRFLALSPALQASLCLTPQSALHSGDSRPDNEALRVVDLPERLQEISDPPLGLFCEGEPGLLAAPQIAIVGSRHPSAYGVSVASMLSRALTMQGFVITSGMAQGVDGIAHQACLGAGGRTTAVLGTGPDQVYPRQHAVLCQTIRDQGLVVSEFPPGTGALGDHFPQRNRLVTGLSLGTVIVEARLRSGSMISARLAMEQGREVFAVPGSILSRQSQGCHQLLRDGAKLTAGISDIVEELRQGLTDVPTAMGAQALALRQVPASLTLQQQQVLAALDLEPQSVDRLCQRLRLAPQSLHAALVCLEIEGLALATVAGYRLAGVDQFADGGRLESPG